MSRTILVVDDSPSVRQMISNTLKSAGYSVVVATDGKEALDSATRARPDAVITDQNMPNLDGLGFCKAFKSSPANASVPIVFLSTESEASMKARAREAGAIGWMVKPFDQQQLLSVVSRLVQP